MSVNANVPRAESWQFFIKEEEKYGDIWVYSGTAIDAYLVQAFYDWFDRNGLDRDNIKPQVKARNSEGEERLLNVEQAFDPRYIED